MEAEEEIVREIVYACGYASERRESANGIVALTACSSGCAVVGAVKRVSSVDGI